MSRTRKPNAGRSRSSKRTGSSGKAWVFVAAPAGLIVVVGVILSMVLQGSPSITLPPGITFPAYIRNSPFAVQEAYAYAIEDPARLQYIPCFCGCGGHSGHTSIHDCFIKYAHITGGGVAFDDHGANCDMCVEIVLDSKKRIEDGQTLQQVRQYVVGKFGSTGLPTDTPPIP